MIPLGMTGREPYPGAQNRVHLRDAEVAGHEDHGLREIHAPVVAESQCSPIEDSQKQMPKSIAGLLNFVEQEKADFDSFGMVLIQSFLGKQSVRFTVTKISRRRTD